MADHGPDVHQQSRRRNAEPGRATGRPGQPVWMGTFHRFCAQLLRRYATLVGLGENYSIYDTTTPNKR